MMRLQNKQAGSAEVDQQPSASKKKTKSGSRFFRSSVGEAETSPWTKGQALTTRSVTVSCWVALFLIWPVVFTFLVGGFSRTAVSAPPPTSQIASTVDQNAGAIAQGFVGSWLSATRTNDAGLSSYADLAAISLPELPFDYRNLTVASVGPKTGSGLIEVQVAAEVKESHLDKDKKEVSTWPQRYFQVAVAVEGSTVSPVGMPRAIASPVVASSKPYGFSQNVPASDPLAQSISSFLQAYAAGVGDITRYTAPTADIAAITPVPYSAVKAQEFKAETEPEPTSADGSTIRTLTRVLLMTASGQQVAADYTLVLQARAGRWEVSEINPDITTKPISNEATPTGK